MINIVDLIRCKRDGGALTDEEILFLVNGYVDGSIPDYQISSWLMACCCKGFTKAEIATLTTAYLNSGRRVKFPTDWPTVDKHSTGGIGDKISLMLAPIVAACGAMVPMISGRGLGHTGGTLDKLESIPGFNTACSLEAFYKLIEKNNLAIIAQSQELVPADKKIYLLRDVTGTVESVGLITASIMSKKLAEGAANLVVDLKTGSGAFMKNMDQARELGVSLQQTGQSMGQRVSVIYSDMNSPLGRACGNALEVAETIAYLKGEEIADIHELTMTLAAEMLYLAGVQKSRETARKAAETALNNGKALEYFIKMIEAQGGDARVVDNPALLPTAPVKIPLLAQRGGYITSIDCTALGYALVGLGAGRLNKESTLDYGAGAELYPKVGDRVQAGQLLGYVYCQKAEQGEAVGKKLLACHTIGDDFVARNELIIEKNLGA